MVFFLFKIGILLYFLQNHFLELISHACFIFYFFPYSITLSNMDMKWITQWGFSISADGNANACETDTDQVSTKSRMEIC